MSAYSSLRITRTKAKTELIARILGDVNDKILEEFMDTILKQRLYNAVIVDDGTANDDDAV